MKGIMDMLFLDPQDQKPADCCPRCGVRFTDTDQDWEEYEDEEDEDFDMDEEDGW